MDEQTAAHPTAPAKRCKWCRNPVTPAGALESEHPDFCSWTHRLDFAEKFPQRGAS